MESEQKLISIIVPFLNEEENLPLLYARITKVFAPLPEQFELLLVDDGSTDNSPNWARNQSNEDGRVKLLRLSRNFGHQIAITAGMDYASGDCAIIMDADLQDPPEIIPEMIANWRNGAEVIYAVRRSREGETWLKKFLAAGFYRFFKSIVKVNIPADAGDFRLLDRKVLDAMSRLRETHRFVRGLTSWVGFTQSRVLYDRHARNAGETKYPVWKSLRLALDAVTSFSGAPLRLMTWGGLALSSCSALLAIQVVLEKMRAPDHATPGWTSLFTLHLFLGGIQLISLGIAGQYISRIYEETKRRPLYFVASKHGISKTPHP
jgi:glycosyltransferase involved in cell wall biosynthesis